MSVFLLLLLLTSLQAVVPNVVEAASVQTYAQDLRQRFNAQCEAYPKRNMDICYFVNVKKAGFDYRRKGAGPISIAVVIPRQEQKPKQKVDQLVLYLQGWRGVCADKKSKKGRTDSRLKPLAFLDNSNIVGPFLREAQKSQNLNSILVFPVSAGKSSRYTYRHRLNHTKQIRGFEDWVSQTFQLEDSSEFFIYGHSGAGTPIRKMVQYGRRFKKQTKYIGLLDATYGCDLGPWKNLVKTNSEVNVETVYKKGSATSKCSKRMARQVKKIKAIPTKTSHCDIPNQFFGQLLKKGFEPFGIGEKLKSKKELPVR